jgi:hypothetical protein
MDFNTQMFAEYEGIVENRNICENRPDGNASARLQKSKSFIPGINENRSIYQFIDMLKSKISDDKKVYKDGLPPPVRLLLDSNCNI